MKNTRKFLSLIISVLIVLSCSSVAFADSDVIRISDYVTPGCGYDVSDTIQSVIDDNPRKTIYFDDGEYLVSKPILTPANPAHAVSISMTDFAVIKATGDWGEKGAVIQLGGKEPFNDTHTNGSNYGLYGGVVDCSGVADGVSINSGRETRIQNTSIKNSVTGLHIMYGANSGSSDSDIFNVNIIGNNQRGSTGVLIEGYDNTITNMRIGAVYYGVVIRSAGNCLRNIHPLFYGSYDSYEDNVGFVIEQGNNWLDYCYSDNFGIGFLSKTNSKFVMNDCFVFWYCDNHETRIAFKAEKKFNAKLTNFTANMRGTKNDKAFVISEKFGSGSITNPIITSTDGMDIYKAYVYDSGIFNDIVRCFWKLIFLFTF